MAKAKQLRPTTLARNKVREARRTLVIGLALVDLMLENVERILVAKDARTGKPDPSQRKRRAR